MKLLLTPLYDYSFRVQTWSKPLSYDVTSSSFIDLPDTCTIDPFQLCTQFGGIEIGHQYVMVS